MFITDENAEAPAIPLEQRPRGTEFSSLSSRRGVALRGASFRRIRQL